MAPILLRMRLSTTADEIAWLECFLGELHDGKLVRTNGVSYLARFLGRCKMEERGDPGIAWAYKIRFGEPERSLGPN